MWGVRPSLTLVSNVWVAVESSIQVKAEQSESKCSSRGMMEQIEERETVQDPWGDPRAWIFKETSRDISKKYLK